MLFYHGMWESTALNSGVVANEISSSSNSLAKLKLSYPLTGRRRDSQRGDPMLLSSKREVKRDRSETLSYALFAIV